ncbi:MAG: hypothetical protein E7A67_01035 [Peptostreptococcus anaerobius]|jgi:hypothetical protein|uniref:hypothetical protein n=1 Tax=Peptostreptococcus anaerobius TaxID=1261 RepID=UPI0029048CE3|nr:hypothetical protein [Peptostreptococcus anaerobius]MDU0963580.1 hypothetical protein [Peptostreptococcus anaerobius]MDU0997468.1 hypothetical protein [Peptostreptococcus anaerobius]
MLSIRKEFNDNVKRMKSVSAERKVKFSNGDTLFSDACFSKKLNDTRHTIRSLKKSLDTKR